MRRFISHQITSRGRISSTTSSIQGLLPYGVKKRSLSTTPSDGNVVNYSQHCVDLVKQHDFDSYLCGLLIPIPARRAFFALRAFNVETGLVKDIARGNALPGQMRMQWWREVIAGIYKNNTPNHPVALALAEAVNDHGLTRRWLDRIMEARMKDLDNIQPTTLAELEEYAEYTASSLLYLTLEAMGIRDATADHAASHIGKATGIVTILRGTRYHANNGTLYIPLDIQRQYKVTETDIVKGPQSAEGAQALHDVFYEIASHAHVHLEHAREMIPQCPQGTATALLPAIRTSMYLEALQKGNFNALDEGLLPKSHFTYQLKLLWATWRGSI